MLKKLTMLLAIAGPILGFATCASADITWTLDDVAFSNGNTATGFFTTNNSVTAIESFSISITGPTTSADFTATAMSSAYLPGVIGIFDSPSLPYVDLYLSPSELTSGGGTVAITSGYDCPTSGGCGTLNLAADPEVIGGPGIAPEPGSMFLFSTGLLGIGFVMRKRLFA